MMYSGSSTSAVLKFQMQTHKLFQESFQIIIYNAIISSTDVLQKNLSSYCCDVKLLDNVLVIVIFGDQLQFCFNINI